MSIFNWKLVKNSQNLVLWLQKIIKIWKKFKDQCNNYSFVPQIDHPEALWIGGFYYLLVHYSCPCWLYYRSTDELFTLLFQSSLFKCVKYYMGNWIRKLYFIHVSIFSFIWNPYCILKQTEGSFSNARYIYLRYILFDMYLK